MKKDIKKYTALVLQGGGALGAYELGALKALYSQEGFAPDIISGVSIGGFSAAVLAGGKKENPVENLEDLWGIFTNSENPFLSSYTELLMSLLFNSGMYYPNPRNFFLPFNTHYYNNTPLYRSLNSVIDFDKLNGEKAPKVIIASTNVGSGEPQLFTNYSNNRITVEQIVSSGSIPPSFKAVEIDDNHYWDGALYSNTPLKPAIKALAAMGKGTECEREIILIELFPNKGPIPQTMPEVYDRSFQLTFQSKVNFDLCRADKCNRLVDLMNDIDQALPQDSPVKDLKFYQEIKQYQKIDKFTLIQHEHDESDAGAIFGTADFRESIIKKRIQQGYEAGMRVVLESADTSTDTNISTNTSTEANLSTLTPIRRAGHN